MENPDSQTGRARRRVRMEDRGFDLEGTPSEGRELSPIDRVGERGQFAGPADGRLPVLERTERPVSASRNFRGLTADERVEERGAAAAVGTVRAPAGSRPAIRWSTTTSRGCSPRASASSARRVVPRGTPPSSGRPRPRARRIGDTSVDSPCRRSPISLCPCMTVIHMHGSSVASHSLHTVHPAGGPKPSACFRAL